MAKKKIAFFLGLDLKRTATNIFLLRRPIKIKKRKTFFFKNRKLPSFIEELLRDGREYFLWDFTLKIWGPRLFWAFFQPRIQIDKLFCKETSNDENVWRKNLVEISSQKL